MIRKLFNNFTYLVSGSAREFDVEQRLFNIATFISVLVAFISILININLGLHYVLHIIIGFGAALLTYIFIRARIYKKFHIWLFIFSALAILSGSWLYNEGPLGSINYLYILALVIFLSVTKRKKHAIVSIVFFLNLIVLYLISFYYPNLIHPYESLEVRNSDLLFTYIYVVVFSALVFSSLRMNYENEKQTVELQNKKIEKQHNQIKDSISYAKHIQTALLQDRDEIKMLFDNSFVFWQPKDIVSGDFYWFKPNPLNSDKIFCTVADCTGHGVPGALLSMLGISYLNEIVLQQPDIEVSDILCRMRGKIKTNLRQHSNQSEFQDGIDMAFCVIDKVSKKLEYAGANNSLYIIRNKKIIELKADRMPVGISYKNGKAFSKQEILLQEEDIIYMFTDGFADQHGGPDYRKFYTARLKEFLLNIADLPLNQQEDKIVQAFSDWKGTFEQTDDVLFVGIKPF